MKKKIFYWSPYLSPVGTVISTINSSVSLSYYSNEYQVSLINVCGEWDNFKSDLIKKNVHVIDLGFKYFKFLPKEGFLQSRFSYLVIFLISFFPLLFLLKKNKPDFIIVHLITSLPILIFKLFTLKTNLVLRISGMPILNYTRKKLWQICSTKIKFVTCPTLELKEKLIKLNIIKREKIFYLPDSVINITEFKRQIKTKNIFKDIFHKDFKIFLAVGRLTKQKNFKYLINEFNKFSLENKNYRLVIFGDGEEYSDLKKQIKKNNLLNSIFLLGRVDNILKYMKDADAFILSSKWEEMGFVIIEAALSNLFIISSNCPNGPSEFLNYGKNGILFDNNKKDALYKSLVKFDKLDNSLKIKDCLKIKKNSLNFTKFRHYKKLRHILNLAY
jgi:glycosyltransferase involved in cell wall biosynthesis